MTISTVDRLDDVKAGIDALELMADAYLCGSYEYDPQATAEAMHKIIDEIRVDLAAARAETEAAIRGSRTA